MNDEIRKIEPSIVWNNFVNLNAIPRPSGQMEKVRSFLLDFGRSLNLETIEDSTGNVIIKKPATKGHEDRETVVLQGHMDMVAQKNSGVDHNFSTQGIEMFIDGDWIRARGTTLGADNGLGVSAILAILESDTLSHPPIEALITYDEETGMTGAMELDNDVLRGSILLNLDTEEDDEIDMGCAGGIDVTASKTYRPEKPLPDSAGFQLMLSGLNGGHSGMDIHKGLGNANKLMNRILHLAYEKCKIQIGTIDGGGLRNAIPRESQVHFIAQKNVASQLELILQKEIDQIKKEYNSIEKNLKIVLKEVETPDQVLSHGDTEALLNTVYAVYNGVYRMSPDIPDLVETSNNVARVEVQNGQIQIKCLTRSAIETGKQDLVNVLTATFRLGGFQITTAADYPGWKPNPDSDVLQVVVDTYQKQNGSKPRVVACHAGLECGILLSHYPNMDAVSFGPTIKGAHSPDERASISSTQKFWKLLLGVLENIPKEKSMLK